MVETENPVAHTLAETLKENIFAEYKDTVFRDQIPIDPAPRGPHGLANIKLKPGTTPKYHRPIPCHDEKLRFLKDEIEDWKLKKKLEPPEPSGWGSPMFMVPKPPGSKKPFRPVIDLRSVNAAAEIDSYTIPLIDEILTRQGRKKIWAKLDLKDAFSQIPLAPEARSIFKLTTPLGDFQPRIMLQGYCNSPSIFQREMDFCLESVSEFACAYFDDIICGTDGVEGESDDDLLLRQCKYPEGFRGSQKI